MLRDIQPRSSNSSEMATGQASDADTGHFRKDGTVLYFSDPYAGWPVRWECPSVSRARHYRARGVSFFASSKGT